MIIKASSVSLAPSGGASANLRCPGCGQLGTFEMVAGNSQDYIFPDNFRVGERRCPNLECRTFVMAIWKNNQIVRCYPALRIDFDKTNIPTTVVSALEEAITLSDIASRGFNLCAGSLSLIRRGRRLRSQAAAVIGITSWGHYSVCRFRKF